MACDEKNYWHTPNTYKGQGVYGVRRSKGFTGRRAGKLFYRGKEWTGPSNLMGRPDLAEAARQGRVAAGAGLA